MFSNVRQLVTYWSCWYFSCVYWWSPGWLLCLCITREILYILPKLATMSVLCSWHVHCLGRVIWWSDRNRQDLLSMSILMNMSFVNKVNNALQTCMSLLYFSFGGSSFKLSWSDFKFLLVTASSAQLLAELLLWSSSGLPWMGDLCESWQLDSTLLRSWLEFLGEGAARFVG